MRILTILFLLLSTFVFAQPVTVMTYNIRYDNPGDGPNRWDARKEKVFALIKKYDPDIIGVQEALHHQLEDIADALKQYAYFGAGRDDGKEKGEYSAVFIRKSRFKVLEQNTFWLSKTPEVPGSKDWDAAITRVATWGKLKDRKSKASFVIINTHFDHVGKESRKNAASLLKEKAASLAQDLPVIVTGDFNFTRDRPPYAVITAPSDIRLIDAAPSDPPGTFCGFVVGAIACNGIDYIFHTAHWQATGYQVIDDNDGKYYPSDHLPVTVRLALDKH